MQCVALAPINVVGQSPSLLLSSKLSDMPVDEAVSGWCEAPGCQKKFFFFIGVMMVLSVLGSTGRIGNVLVALR